MGIHLHVHTVGCGKGYILKSTLLVIERNNNLTLTLLTVERETFPTSTPCWWWKGTHPHVHTFVCGNECILTSTLLVVDTYIPLKVNAVNAVKPECQNAGKNQSGIGIWTSTRQSQSCIVIPASVRV